MRRTAVTMVMVALLAAACATAPRGVMVDGPVTIEWRAKATSGPDLQFAMLFCYLALMIRHVYGCGR